MQSLLPRVSPHLALVALMGAALFLGGCDSQMNPWETKSLLNPAELGRFDKKAMLVPIVSTLDTGIDEPNDQFSSATEVRPEDLIASKSDYLIGKNDLLTISITDLIGPNVETVKSVRVSETGNVSLPLVGQVRAEGLSEAQLETEIQRAYREANIISNAQVSVNIAQGISRTFSILGSVARPGQYSITQSDFRVLDALVTAGDINSQGIDNLYVVRRDDLAPQPPKNSATPASSSPGTPAAPGSPGDVLQPRSSADGVIPFKPVVLADAAANAPASTTAPGGEGRYITIDGKEVLIGNRGATAEPAANATPKPAAEPAPAAKPNAPAEPAEPAPSPAAAPPAAPTAAPAPQAAPAQPEQTPSDKGFAFENPTASPHTRIIRVPIDDLKNGDLRYNIVIHPQDMIIVPQPQTGEYYMDGHVNRTGVYSLTARQITVEMAVAAAGGCDQLAIPSRTEIIRRIGKDKQVFARIDLDKIASGDQPEIYLKPNDIVRVGTNILAPFLASFRTAFRITYGFGFLYDQNFAPQNNNQGF